MDKLTLINKEDESFAKNKLSKYYKDNLIPAEKKAYLTNLKESHGAFLGIESSNNETHYMMDAASQIATLGLGFNSSVFMGTAHYLESWTNNSQSKKFLNLRSAFENFLKRKTNWDRISTTFCNSGAEANEIALGYCFARRENKEAKKVLAFEGSFHGRMLVSLASTWNQSKREPFQFPGFETVFSPFPELKDEKFHLEIPKGWRKTWELASLSKFELNKEWLKDQVLKLEIDCLLDVREQILSKEIFAIIIEPMQCEGGDRYASGRFFNALTLMAKSFNIPIIFDEVQTGFHLGEDFFWHKSFDLQDHKGNQLLADYVTCAKKAQTGLVISPTLEKSNFEKDEQFLVTSVIRGYLHAYALDQAKEKIEQLQKQSSNLLEKFCNKFEDYVERPRGVGLCFAFDLKTSSHIQEFIAKRFDHGLLYYPAGSSTLRFRLNTAFDLQDLEFLYERLTEIANEVFLNKTSSKVIEYNSRPRSNENIYRWQEFLLKAKISQFEGNSLTTTELIKEINTIFSEQTDSNLILIDKTNYHEFKDQIQNLQKLVYEPTRQTSEERFKIAATSETSICLGLVINNKLMSMAFASAMADHPLERGLRQDPHFNDSKSVYVIDTTVHPEMQGNGTGRQMKYALSLIAQSMGVERIKGRNRDKMAVGMFYINLSMGAYEQLYLKEDYPDFELYRDVIYYTTDLNWEKEELSLGNRIDSHLSSQDLNLQYLQEQLPYITNKVCLSNFVSTRFLDDVQEILSLLPPSLRHGYTASGQSESVDKIAKSIFYNDKKAHKMITFKDHYFGNGSFLSRSLSQEENNFYPVVHLDHPNEQNWQEVLKEVETTLSKEDFLGVWIEPICQKTLEKVPHKFLKALRELTRRKTTNLIYNETSSHLFTYDKELYFISNDKDITPDAMMCFLGGQASIIGVEESIFIEKPLMMISTWDGDEFSFSQYKMASNKITNNKATFEKELDIFTENLKSLIAAFDGEILNETRGKFRFKANLPIFISKLFKSKDDYYLVDSNFSQMITFNASVNELLANNT